FGVIIAHPDYARLMEEARTNPAHPELPEISEIRTGLVGAVMRRWNGRERFEDSIRGEDGRDYLFRLQKFSQGDEYGGYSLFFSAEDDFSQNVRRLQVRGIVFFLIVGAFFIPPSSIFRD